MTPLARAAMWGAGQPQGIPIWHLECVPLTLSNLPLLLSLIYPQPSGHQAPHVRNGTLELGTDRRDRVVASGSH